MVVATQVVLITAAAMVDAASMSDGVGRRLCEDGHDPDPSCAPTLKPKENLLEEIQCSFVVAHTALKVTKPLIQDSNVGAGCNREIEGLVHDRICETCGNKHEPCSNTFTSCRGCCASPSKHVPLRAQNCPLIQSYFSRDEASCKVELRPPNKTGEPWKEPDVTEEIVATDSLYSDIIRRQCNVTLNSYDCPKVPARVDFECNQCNKGSPSLLKDCCDRCVKFAESRKLANLTTILPFVVCNGCDTKVIFTPSHDRAKAAIETDPATKYWESWVAKGRQTMPWFAAGGYQNYSATAAQAKMNGWIETNICNAFEPETCGADHQYPPGRRLLHSGGGHDQTNFSFDEECRRQQEVQASTATSATTTSRNTSMLDKTPTTTTSSKHNDSSWSRRVPVTLIIVAGVGFCINLA